MAELSNAQLVAFSNEVMRPVADALATLDRKLAGLALEYTAKNLGTVIEAGGAGNLIADGSAIDGRTRVAGGDIYNLVTLAANIATVFNGGGVRDVVAKWQTNGYR